MNWSNGIKDSRGYFKDSEIFKILSTTYLFRKPKISKRSIINVLEIGTFEGVLDVYFSSFASMIHTVDPFDMSETTTKIASDTEKNFLENKNNARFGSRINQFKMTSDKYFSICETNFDFIYIDGNHEPNQVLRDLENAMRHINARGYIWIDDYKSGYKNLKQIVDTWIMKNVNKIEIVHSGYQLGTQVVSKYSNMWV